MVPLKDLGHHLKDRFATQSYAFANNKRLLRFFLDLAILAILANGSRPLHVYHHHQLKRYAFNNRLRFLSSQAVTTSEHVTNLLFPWDQGNYSRYS